MAFAVQHAERVRLADSSLLDMPLEDADKALKADAGLGECYD